MGVRIAMYRLKNDDHARSSTRRAAEDFTPDLFGPADGRRFNQTLR